MNVCRRFAPLACLAALAAAGAPTEKMCWAHYVGWGFDQVAGYDRAFADPAWYAQRFNDRSLLGRHAQTDEGVGEATPLQVRTALAYGIDGFCVDLVIREGASESFYADAMARFYRAAEGTPFKVALCVDSTPASPQAMARAFAAFLRRWGRHPNSCLVDGKPVVFVYNPRPRTLDEWRGMLESLRGQGLAATWLVQPMGEGTLWDKPEVLAGHLAVFDGLYDFGINGYTPEQMRTRLANGKRALAAAGRPDGLWSAGITVGYLGNVNSFYRPYLNTGTLRANWEAAVATGAPWVCLTTWNDYVENTHFEPSAVNRDALLRINRDLVARWRGAPPPPRPPQVFASYHEEVSLGDDLTLEVLSLPYHTAPASLAVRLIPLAPSTNGVLAFDVALPCAELRAETLRVPHPFLGEGGGVYAVQARLSTDDAWHSLYPIAVRAGHLESLRTIHIALDELAAEPQLTLASEGGRRVARVRLDRWNLAGRVELLRNGWPVAEAELAHKGAPFTTVALPLPATEATPDDLYVVRYGTLSGLVAWSGPARVQTAPACSGGALERVVVTGEDFDEGWGGSPRPGAPTPSVQSSPIRAPYALTYPMDEGTGDVLRSTSGWETPLFLGRTHQRLHQSGATEQRPQWVDGGDGRPALRFDGTNGCAVLPSRSFPYGPFTLELNVRPEAADRSMALFSDANGVRLMLVRGGLLAATRGRDAIGGQRALTAGRWAHVALVYDGAHLRLYLDGQLEREVPAETRPMRINSLPAIGGASGAAYRGLVGGLHLQSGVLEPGQFRLQPRGRTP